jgi:ABC-type microcin C transport system permease subunit YejE
MDQALYLNQRERYYEFEGIAEALGVPTSRVILANYAYEYVAFCTSIIAKEKNGTIMHMRILDFIAPELQKPQTYIGEFYRDGKMIFSAVLTGGTPTFPTGYKQGAFSITLNQRNPTRG